MQIYYVKIMEDIQSLHFWLTLQGLTISSHFDLSNVILLFGSCLIVWEQASDAASI